MEIRETGKLASMLVVGLRVKQPRTRSRCLWNDVFIATLALLKLLERAIMFHRCDQLSEVGYSARCVSPLFNIGEPPVFFSLRFW